MMDIKDRQPGAASDSSVIKSYTIIIPFIDRLQ